MITETKGSENRPKTQFRAVHKRVLFRLLRYVKCQKRCFAAAAVILFAFFGLNLFQSSAESLGLEKYNFFDKEESADDLIEEFSSSLFTRDLFESGLDIAAAVMPTAYAGIDFSADDQMEEYYFDIMEGSGLISQANPAGGDIFGGLRRDVITYAVKDGDTVFDLAVRFNITANTILWANNLGERDIIKPGQQLLILPINGVRIKVASGDTIGGIAKKYNAKAGEIMAFNHLISEGSLAAGEYLVIPDGEMPAPVVAPAKPKAIAPKFATGTTKANSWLITPTTGHNWGRLHNYNAVDIANACGTPIYAAAAGKVILADSSGWNGGYGKYIKIQHPNGVITLYGHASQLMVKVGDQVAQGQLIMLMGTTGRSTGCHLHFEVRGATNPLTR